MKLLLVLCLCLAAVPALATPPLFDQIMAALKAAPVTGAAFTETKTMAMVDTPIVSSGEVSYAPPDRIEKVTTSPEPERLLLEGDRLTIKRDNQTRTLSIEDHPEIGVFVGAVRDLLAGDGVDLSQHYTVTTTGALAAWKMALVPSDPEARKLVQSIEVAGARGRVKTITTLQADGDSTIMTIEAAP